MSEVGEGGRAGRKAGAVVRKREGTACEGRGRGDRVTAGGSVRNSMEVASWQERRLKGGRARRMEGSVGERVGPGAARRGGDWTQEGSHEGPWGRGGGGARAAE